MAVAAVTGMRAAERGRGREEERLGGVCACVCVCVSVCGEREGECRSPVVVLPVG